MTPSLLPTTALASLLCLACATPALAQSADLNTWTKAGDARVTSASSATLTTAYLDESPLPADGALHFTWAGVPFHYRRGATTTLRVQTASGWLDCPDLQFAPGGVLAVAVEVAFAEG